MSAAIEGLSISPGTWRMAVQLIVRHHATKALSLVGGVFWPLEYVQRVPFPLLASGLNSSPANAPGQTTTWAGVPVVRLPSLGRSRAQGATVVPQNSLVRLWPAPSTRVALVF